MRTRWRRFLMGAVLVAGCVSPAWAATLWSVASSYLGTGYFFGPGAYMTPTPLFPVVIRNLGFISDRDFVTPFWNKGSRLSDGTRINENVDTGIFTLAGTRFLPAVVEGGKFSGQQVAVTMADGNLVMVMDLVLDLGIGPKGIIRMPFYGTTGTLTIPGPLTAAGAQRAGLLRTGETISGRIGDFNGDGYIDGTLVAVGVMPLSSPIYPGQPWAMSRNFETNIPIQGILAGSAREVNRAYGLAPGEGEGDHAKR
jgi:hypothetical protein